MLRYDTGSVPPATAREAGALPQKPARDVTSSDPCRRGPLGASGERTRAAEGRSWRRGKADFCALARATSACRAAQFPTYAAPLPAAPRRFGDRRGNRSRSLVSEGADLYSEPTMEDNSVRIGSVPPFHGRRFWGRLTRGSLHVAWAPRRQPRAISLSPFGAWVTGTIESREGNAERRRQRIRRPEKRRRTKLLHGTPQEYLSCVVGARSVASPDVNSRLKGRP